MAKAKPISEEIVSEAQEVEVEATAIAEITDAQVYKVPLPADRKYTWHGITPRNPATYNQYGNVRIRPWAMTDDEIDACIRQYPDLARLWTAREE